MLEVVGYVFILFVVSFGFVAFFGAPYVPTLKREVGDVMKIYPLSSKDTFVDIGSGDGVLLRAASRQGARAIGYELSPWLYFVSLFFNRKYSNINVKYGNFWHKQLPDEATVAYTFLSSRHIQKLGDKLQVHVNRTQKPLHFISYGFAIPDKKVVRKEGAMFLYTFSPLQP